MGVPKLFRWLSERYPCLSEKVQEWQIPEFDNLYLDMNGIIHNCSHPNDDDIQFRISEEQIFKDIFNYIDFLFKTIKPKKVFYMAIDGVAPRAKMNQQRSRRFRTAKEAHDKEQEAIKKGKVLPKEQRFDSNCITPGTDFMIRLQEQLKYFVVKKISTDDLWKNVKVHLSGHEAPGEGEHKIMDFIRYMRSQPDYDPYTRHCLYGLDADLIMLGIVTHEPYFSLLREEVKYVKVKSKEKKPTGPENINFHLFHLTILRDYLETEFSKIKENHSSLFNLEKIIDDWVFLCILVGNDFIPHLPHYHINKNSLIILYETYMELLPKLNGYINEGGVLNLERLELFFEKLGEIELERFNENNQEFEIFDKLPSKFLKEDRHLANFFEDNEDVKEENLESESEESENYFSDNDNCFLTNNEFELHKYNYYKKKLNFNNITEEIVREHTLSYIEAIQWNLYYYFEGCCSWTWYYPYHYAPYVSDIKNFKNTKIKFDKDQPLLPYEQLLGVLPIASKRFLPESFQQIMISKDSPLVGCYPTDFKLDYNGKTQQWEAVVLIPFIKEDLLKKASSIAKKGLTEDEKKHNIHGPHLLFTYTEIPQPLYESNLPHVFPAIANNRAKCIEISSSKYVIPSNKINKGISKKIKLQTHFFGFPSLKFLKYKSEIKNEKIKVFDTLSKGDNVILYLENNCDNDVSNLSQYLEKNIYFNWPYPKECKLKSYFDGQFLYSIKKNVVFKKKLESREINIYFEKIKSLEDFLLEKKGIKITSETGLCLVEPVIGFYMKVNEDGTITREKQYSSSQVLVLARTVMPKLKLKVAKTNDVEKAVDIFKPGNKCFLLEKNYYGDMGEIITYNHLDNKVKVRVMISDEPDLSDVMEREEEILFDNYKSSSQIARFFNMNSLSISKITGCVFVYVNKKKNIKANIGLNLKFNERNQQMANYSKKINDIWFFSNKVSEIIYEYIEKFPSVIDQIAKYKKLDELEIKDLFPFGNSEAQFKELLDFLKNLPFSRDKRQNIEDNILDECIVNVIEETLQSSIMLIEDSKPMVIETDVKNVFVSIPALTKTHPDPTAEFMIFDRVVNVRQGSIVPQGLKGIVIGIEEKLEEDKNPLITVVFDEVFEGGLCINTKQNRCYVLPQSYLMNISFGKNKKNKNKENLLDCILPPVKSKHFQKETFTAPKHKVENPFYDESKNYWAKLSLKEQNSKSKKIQNGNSKSPFSVKLDKNKQENSNNIKTKKNDRSPTKEQKGFKNKPVYTILKNDNGFKQKEMLKENLSLNNYLKLKEENGFKNKELSKEDSLIDGSKLKNYFFKRLNYYCQDKYKSKPRLSLTKGIDKNTVQINVPKSNETVTYYKDLDVKIEKDESYEEICKTILKQFNLSTILPPTFVLDNEENLAKNFLLPNPPKSWLS